MGNNSTRPQVDLDNEGAEIYEYLSNMQLFKKETPKQLARVAAALRLEKFSRGDVIITQGEESNSMFIIAEGRVSFMHRDPATGQERIVQSISKEDTCGEFGLVYNVRRTAAAIATSEHVVALKLDRDTYHKIKSTKYMKPLTKKVENVCASLMRDGLASLPMMGGVKRKEIEEICHLFRFEVIPKGTALIHEGQKPQRFYLIHEGIVVVTRLDEYSLPYELSRLRKGEGFGERALINKGVTEASVTTLTTCEVFSLDAIDFRRFVSTMAQSERKKLARASFSSALKGSVPIFNHLGGTSLNLLCATCVSKTIEKGTILIKENTTENKSLSVILSGKVTVKQNGDTINVMTSGYFGEASMFIEGPSNGTVIATTKLQLLQIPLDTFKLVLQREPIVYSEIALRVLGRHVSLSILIQHPTARDNFMLHCQSEFSEESVLFLEEVRKLENLKDKKLDPEVEKAMNLDPGHFTKIKKRILKDKARTIYSEYILSESPREINISDQRKTQMKHLIDNRQYDFNMYRSIKEDILNLVEQDTFARYKDSSQFTEMLSDIGLYSILS